MHYITQNFPNSSFLLNLGNTRVVYDIVRVPSIPNEIKKNAISLINDGVLAARLGVTTNNEFVKPDGKQATFWYVKVVSDAQGRLEYYRINMSFMDNAELIDFDNCIDEEVYLLCQNRKVNPVEDGYTTNAIEFRCSELGIFPTREDKYLVLREPISNNEARVIAKHGSTKGVDMLAEYDGSYHHAIKTGDVQPVMNALTEWDLI